jgi:hypothetical protein
MYVHVHHVPCSLALLTCDLQYPYSLTSGMPPAPIADEERTLEAAGLLNAVIIQRK